MIRFRESSKRKCRGVAKDQYYMDGKEWPGQVTRIVIDGRRTALLRVLVPARGYYCK
jgi:hypothetical protein